MPTKSYQVDQLKRLTDSGYAAQYLNAAWQETLDDGDVEAFLLALKNVISAAETTQKETSKIHLLDPNISHLLSEESPKLETIITALKAVNLTIDFRPLGS
ncbi:MAG: DNA-binding protein [Leptolyngbyaceae cyanobacterium]